MTSAGWLAPDNPPMHLLIPFAAPLSDAGQQALRELRLPTLDALLARLTPTALTEGDEYRLSMPQERVLAEAFGWTGDDGALPWAARAAAADGIEVGELAWGLLSPVHWQVGREHLTMGDPAALDLDAATSRAYFDAVRPQFESLGWRCAWGAPTRWYVAHESLAGLPTASIDRVIGRNPDLWMPAHPAARLLKRLQAELQMLLYTHPLNDAREAAGREPLNSVWLSGCGAYQPERGAAPQLEEALRGPALREDWPAWQQAWRALDDGLLREAQAALQRGAPLALTLCGERHAQRYEARPLGIVASLRSRWQRADAAALLAGL